MNKRLSGIVPGSRLFKLLSLFCVILLWQSELHTKGNLDIAVLAIAVTLKYLGQT